MYKSVLEYLQFIQETQETQDSQRIIQDSQRIQDSQCIQGTRISHKRKLASSTIKTKSLKKQHIEPLYEEVAFSHTLIDVSGDSYIIETFTEVEHIDTNIVKEYCEHNWEEKMFRIIRGKRRQIYVNHMGKLYYYTEAGNIVFERAWDYWLFQVYQICINCKYERLHR